MVERDRGQLILVGAILIALTIVASAVLLNSVYSSADVQSQQDRQALDRTNQVVGQIQDNLYEMFVANGSQPVTDGQTRFVDSANISKFGSLVETYERQYLNLSTRERSTFVNVTFNESGSVKGSLVYQNETESLENFEPHDGNPAIDIAYLYINITELESGTNNDISISGLSNDITLDPTTAPDVEIRVDGETKCANTVVSEDEPVEIELVRGIGELRTADCSPASIDISNQLEGEDGNIQFNEDFEGQTTVLFTGPANPVNLGASASRGIETGALIAPKFKITYQDSQVYYEGNVTLYGDTS
jgi:hypothetical protein